ncbi:M20/M25/M40 family metallo-hydrolase [bacterium]|nr:M20/M25/M40 family metallo-hydrolase [bacterium]
MTARCPVLSVLAAVWLTVVPVDGAGAREAPPRNPLAVTLGAVEAPAWERPEGTPLHGRGPDDLLLRTPPDSLITALMDSTSLIRMVGTIQRLQDFGSRYVVVDSCWAAGLWIRDRFEEYGYADVRLDTFRTMSFQDSVAAMNVIAVKEGTTRPSEYVVLGGHYDSVNAENFYDPLALAPGADDNATAVAAVLEAARLLKDVPTDRSIIFACWSAEEVGLWGSRHFVAEAVEESLDIVVYLNMDCLGYIEPSPDEAPVIVFTDSLSFAIAGYMQTLAHTHTQYRLQTCVRPIGASDHTSFWEAGYNVVDMGTTIASPYRHTTDDILDNLDPDFARALAAVNVAATAAVAGVTGEDANLPPETVRVANCAASVSPVTMRPTFEWNGVDFDGSVARYEYAVESDIDAGNGTRGDRPLDWTPLPACQTSLTLKDLSEGAHVFHVRAIDDKDVEDPSPVVYEFVTDSSLRPLLTVDLNFFPGTRTFVGQRAGDRTLPVVVYENERLTFAIVADASSYCGSADSVAVAIADSTAWSEWYPSPCGFVLRPTPADTVVFLKTRDENGAITIGRVSLRTVPTPMDRPLLRVDDWFVSGVPDEATHDAFYNDVLAGESCDVWDPFDHIENCVPMLPPMEELGRYRTVLWTLDWRGGFLHALQAESAYHYLEGLVRAGGNVILEGQSSLLAMDGAGQYVDEVTYESGEFIFDHVGVDSFRNAGASTNESSPGRYGYAFLGGIATETGGLPDVPVDTLGKWADGYQAYGGLPYCEVVRPLEQTRTLYVFDSYINPEVRELPCATVRYADDGTGTFAYFGFPLYYLQTDPAAEMLGLLLDSIESWQQPAALSFFVWEAAPDSVTLSWYLTADGDSLGCSLERTAGDGSGGYHALSDSLLRPDANGRYRFLDGSVAASTTYLYRLVVSEQWGVTTTHGPWEIQTPSSRSSPWLENPRPNPFSETLSLHYGIVADGRWVSVGVFDVAGRLVRALREGAAQTGEYDLTWDGTNERGDPVASGVYFVRVRVGPETFERKVVFLR